MKTLYFLLFTLCAGQLYGQAILNQTIPATLGATSTLRAPNGTTSHTTIRAHYMIYASELTSLPVGAQITSVGFVYVNGGNIAAGGNIKLYLENSTATSNTKSLNWATAITGMDSVYDGAYSIPISTTPTTSTIVLSDTFTYAGNGIQVAYDYLGTAFATTAATYDCNNSVSGDLKMVATTTTTPGTTLNGFSSWRPGLYIGYVNPFTNDMAVDFLVLDQGHHNKVYNGSQTITGTVRNKSQGTLTSIPVSLDITGANPSSSTQTIPSLAAGASQVVTFNALTTSNAGMQTVKLSVPSDQFTTNDSLVLVQSINCDTISYADNSAPYSSAGFNTGTGILAVKHTGSSTVSSSVKSIYLELSNDTRNTGNQLQGFLLNSGGTIIDSSAAITVTAAQLGTKVSFPLTGNNVITPANPDFYIGIRQSQNTTTGYFPFASLNPENPPAGRYFGFLPTGGTPGASITTLGTLGVGATIIAEGITLTSSASNDSICEGEPLTLTASGATLTSYDFKASGTSVQNSAATSYTGSPATTTTYLVEGSLNSCPLASNPVTIHVTSIDSSASKTNDSTGAASMAGASYQWIDCGTGMAVAGATSRVFTASVSGNYQVAVSLNGCSDTSSCYSFIVPVTSINENSIRSLQIFPSPASNLLHVKTDAVAIRRITILDVNGRMVWNTSPNNPMSIIDVSNLKPGVYLISVSTEKGQETRRFIKQ